MPTPKKCALPRRCFMAIPAALLLMAGTAKAQVNKSKFGPVTTTVTVVNPYMLKASETLRPLKYSDFKKTALYGTRQRLYRTSFNNPAKSFTLQDGTSMSIFLKKNPPFVSQGSQVIPHFTTGPIHGGSANVPANYSIEPDQSWTYHSYHAQLQSTSVDFSIPDYNTQVAYIYPGAIYTFDSYMNGSFLTPSVADRHPIVIATDNPNAQKNFIDVEHPTASTVKSTISDMKDHFIAAGTAQTTYTYFESNNMADWAIKANKGGSNQGANQLNNDFFNSTDRRHHRYITIDVSKKLYTLFTNPPSNGFYPMNNSTEGTPNLLVVGAVNYGVRLLVTMELSFPNSALASDFEGKIGLLKYTGSLDMGYLQSHAAEITKIKGYQIGGAHAGWVTISKTGIQAAINGILSGVNVHNAAPVSYRLYDMAWDIIGATASTGLFNYVNGVPNPTLASVKVSISCGDDGKNAGTSYYYSLFPPTGPAVASYAGTAGHSPWQDHTGGHNNTLSVTSGKSLDLFTTGTSIFRMIITKQGAVPQNDLNFFLNPVVGFAQTITTSLQNALTSFDKDDIHPFTILLSLSFTQPGQSALKTYNLSWSNQAISTKSNSMLQLKFHYANGNFIKL